LNVSALKGRHSLLYDAQILKYAIYSFNNSILSLQMSRTREDLYMLFECKHTHVMKNDETNGRYDAKKL